YRFERGADVGICVWASHRAAQLMLASAGGQLASGLIDAYPKPAEPRQITLHPQNATRLLGVEMRAEEMEIYLHQLGLKGVGRKPRPLDVDSGTVEPLTFRVPTFRVDLKREVDLIEEIGRLYGVDRIPATTPRGA